VNAPGNEPMGKWGLTDPAALRQQCLDLNARGFRTFPVHVTSGTEKRPAVVGWSDSEVPYRRSEAGRFPFRWGMSLGLLVPPGEVVLDIDQKPGKKRHGYRDLRALERRLGPLPRTRAQVTGSGGQHRWFRVVGGLPAHLKPELIVPSGAKAAIDLVHRGHRYLCLYSQGWLDEPLTDLPESWHRPVTRA